LNQTVWMCAENIARNGIRFPDQPDRSTSLYKLRYPDPQYNTQERSGD